MYHYHNNTPCITGQQFIDMFSFSTYHNGTKRNYFVKHGRGGNGRDVSIEVSTMRRMDLKTKIIKEVGPLEDVKKTDYLLAVERDAAAFDFFRNYRYLNGDKETSLPEDVKPQYVNEASILNMLDRVMKMQIEARQSKPNNKLRVNEFWMDAISAIRSNPIKTDFPHRLPDSERHLERKFKRYLKEGYVSLISGKFGNRNTERVCDEAKIWLLAMWANHVEKVTSETHLFELYNAKAKVTEGWKTIKSPNTLHNFLYEPEIYSLWYGHRYGESKSKEKFTLFNTTKMPVLRDTLWYSDGTKLNYFYLNEEGKIRTTSVYEVMDVSSEFLLGYHISDSEDFVAQYKAYRMALQTAGHKPYEIAYDNQGGHKKLETSDFLKNLAHLCIRTKPYNGKSKTIELAFGRFQQEFLKRDWFFTGQNITAKKQESKANMEFVVANRSNLPSLDEIKKAYEKRRNEWNSAPHPKSEMSRRDTYYSTVNEQSPILQIGDMVELFWITRKEEVTYTADGLKFTEAKTDYKYLKYTEPLKPDFDFHFDNIGRKFVVRFDPEDMTMIWVYERDSQGQLRFVTEMTTKIEIHRAKQEQDEWEVAYIQHINRKNDEKRTAVWQQMEAVLRRQGVHPEQHGLVSPHLRGIEAPAKYGERQQKVREVRQRHDWEKATPNWECPMSNWEKEVSNAVLVGDGEQEDDIYQMI
jgi:hypothetical protein